MIDRNLRHLMLKIVLESSRQRISLQYQQLCAMKTMGDILDSSPVTTGVIEDLGFPTLDSQLDVGVLPRQYKLSRY